MGKGRDLGSKPTMYLSSLIEMIFFHFLLGYNLHKEHNFKCIIWCIFLKSLFIYLFIAVLGLRCCSWAFSSCGERGLLFVLVCRPLIAVVSVVVEHGL